VVKAVRYGDGDKRYREYGPGDEPRVSTTDRA